MRNVRQQMSVVLIALVFVLSISFSFALDNPSFFKGFTHMNDAHYDEAIMYFNISLKANPDYLPAYSHLALCYERKGDYIKAAEIWIKYSEFNSYFKDTVITHIELIDKFLKAEEYLEADQSKEAMPLLEEIAATDKYPMSVLWINAAKILGEIYFKGKSYDRVINLYEKISLYYPKDVTEDIMFRYAYSYQHAREFQKAIDIYKKLDQQFKIKDKGNITKYKNMVSLCYEGLGDEAFAQDDRKKAKEIYEIVLKGFPATENVNRVNQKKQKVEEQLAFFYKTEGDTYTQMKEYSKAIGFYKKVISDCPNTEKCTYAQGQIALLKKMESEYLRRIYSHYDEGEYKQAQELCHISLEQFPTGHHAPLIQFLLGCTYSNCGEYRKAIPELLKLVKDYPKSPLADDALDRIGIFYWYVLGKKDKALKVFKYLIAKYPEGNFAPSALYHCGRLYSEMGNHRSAYMMFKRIIEKHPKDTLLVRKANLRIQMIKEAIENENTKRK